MKNYKVKAIRNFRDSNEIDEKTGLKIERKINDEFYCTKERYEFLKQNNAVKLVEIEEKFVKGGGIKGKVESTPEIGEVVVPIAKPKKKKTSKK